jgi:hypothetical protein
MKIVVALFALVAVAIGSPLPQTQTFVSPDGRQMMQTSNQVSPDGSTSTSSSSSSSS